MLQVADLMAKCARSTKDLSQCATPMVIRTKGQDLNILKRSDGLEGANAPPEP